MNKLSLLLLLLCGFQLNGQTLRDRCGPPTTSIPTALNNEIEAFTAEWITNYRNNPIQTREVITIPVVVHVVWHNPEENISDLQIESQIDATNADFRKKNANLNAAIPIEFLDQAVDTEIQFCLATVDPFGNPTNGITRTETEIDNIASASSPGNVPPVYYTDLGGKDGWSPDKYLNIWVAPTAGIELGKGCRPGECPSAEDGIRIDPKFFGTTCNTFSPYNLGRTTTHEIGHFLNLIHLWGTLSNNDECAEDDMVSDTPPQNGPNFGCPTHPHESCGGNEMFFNFMDWSDDDCMAMFTEGQKLRMLAALNGPRSTLLTSNGCGLINPRPKSLSNNSIAIFPNPVSECLHIDIDIDLENQTPIVITLHNSMGQRLFRSVNAPDDVRSVDVTSLVPGVYFVNFELDSQSVTKRIVVK